MRISDWSSDVCSSDLFDEQEAESQPQATATTKRKLNPKNDKDARELMTLLQVKAMSDLYKNDPLVRQDMDAQAAKEAAKALQQAKESNEIGRASCRERVCQYG